MKPTRPASGDREVRRWAINDIELRSQGDGGPLVLTGYASVFDKGYEMYGGPEKGGWTEYVDQGAFDTTLRNKPDVQLLVNHEGMPLARTKSGTLQLSTDKVGLKVYAELNPDDPDVGALAPKMQRGDMDEMSFAFRTVRQEWNEEYTERRLLELNLQKGDVSVVNYGANPATSSSIRSIDVLGHLAALDVDELVAELRADGGANPADMLARASAVIEQLGAAMAAAGWAAAAGELALDSWRSELDAQKAAAGI
jgi:HK97 family phage prohead protease